MNRALKLKNWKDGGNNYIKESYSQNKWTGFQKSVITRLIESFGDEFNIVILTDKKNDNDFYCIPFRVLKHLFVDEYMTTGQFTNRWTATIASHRFEMRSNSNLSVEISSFYAVPLNQETALDLEDDYFIEDAKAEIKIRLGQSKFRKKVLANFANKCALTGISEESLLTASHVVPWSHRKDLRADIANGICLYIEIDALFDKGYISFTDDLRVIVASNKSKMSRHLQDKLEQLNGKQLRHPKMKRLKEDYLEYHRKNIFRK